METHNFQGSYLVTGCNRWATVVIPWHDESLNKVVVIFLGFLLVALQMPLNSHDKGGEWVDFVFCCLRSFSVTLLMLCQGTATFSNDRDTNHPNTSWRAPSERL